MGDDTTIGRITGAPTQSLDANLEIADWVLFAAGAVIVVSVVICWVTKSRGDPLATSGIPVNRLGAEGVLLPVLVWVAAGSLLAAFIGASDTPQASTVMIFAGNLAQACGACACLWVAKSAFDAGAVVFLLGPPDRRGSQVRNAVAVFLAALTICATAYFVTLYVIGLFEPDYRVFEHEVIDALRDRGAPLWLFWVGTTVGAPLCEEVFFRGMLIPFLINILRRRWSAVLLSSLLFGAVHAGPDAAPQPHVVPALTAFGILLGVFYVRTGSLVGPIIAHALFNAKTILWESLSSTGA